MENIYDKGENSSVADAGGASSHVMGNDDSTIRNLSCSEKQEVCEEGFQSEIINYFVREDLKLHNMDVNDNVMDNTDGDDVSKMMTCNMCRTPCRTAYINCDISVSDLSNNRDMSLS